MGKNGKRIRLLKRLRSLIPQFDCIKGCSDCCGVVPIATIEKKAMKHIRKVTGTECQYKGENGCANYKDRPLICRMFGTTDIPYLTCVHGCHPEPDKMLKPHYANAIMIKYMNEVMTKEDGEAIHNIWLKHQENDPALKKIAEQARKSYRPF